MRKHMIIMALFLLVCIGGSVAVFGTLRYIEKNEIIKEETRIGDASAAAGLTVSFLEYPLLYGEEKTSWGDYEETRISDVQWKHVIRLTEKGCEISTDIIHDTDALLAEEEEWRRNERIGYAMRNWQMQWCVYGVYGFGSWFHYDNVLEKKLSLSLVLDMKASNEPTRVRLADYMDYYPAIDRIVLPWLDENGEIEEYRSFELDTYKDSSFYDSSTSTFDAIKEEEMDKKARTIEEYFKIPVIQNEVIEFTRFEEEGYDYIGLNRESVGEDSFEPYWHSVLTEDAVLFTFNTHTENGAVVDTSLIPGGYGIYRLPYTMKKDGNTDVKEDELGVFYTMDPASDVFDIELTLDQKTLMIIYELDGMLRCSLIDTNTGECLCDAALMPKIEEKYWYLSAACGEDYIALGIVRPTNRLTDYDREDAPLWVFGKNKNGQYGELLHSEGGAFLEPSLGNVIFDGERLAQVSQVDLEYLRITVYTKDGIIYQGRYDFPQKYISPREGDLEGKTEIRNIRLQWEK